MNLPMESFYIVNIVFAFLPAITNAGLLDSINLLGNGGNNSNRDRTLLGGSSDLLNLNALGIGSSRPNAPSRTGLVNNLVGFNLGTNKMTREQALAESQKLLDRLTKLQEQANKRNEEKENNKNNTDIKDDKPILTEHEYNIKNDDNHNKDVILKSITKDMFWFQVQPVVPENEIKDYNFTLYYED